MKDVKIVFTDLDSTLTKENGHIDIEYKKIFERLSDIGIPVVINTGRSIPYTIPICKQYMTSKYLIGSNGAEVYNFITKKTIYRSIISKENLIFFDNLINKYNLFFTANGLNKRYSNKNFDNVGLYYVDKLDNIDDTIAQVVIESYDVDAMKNLRKELSENKELKIANKTKHIKEGKLLYYDIVNSNVSKGVALKVLCNELNIDSEKAMAVGDSTNDLEMLKEAGYKVAVANASDDLKSIADVVTLSNKENGVLVVLTELYKNKIKGE